MSFHAPCPGGPYICACAELLRVVLSCLSLPLACRMLGAERLCLMPLLHPCDARSCAPCRSPQRRSLCCPWASAAALPHPGAQVCGRADICAPAPGAKARPGSPPVQQLRQPVPPAGAARSTCSALGHLSAACEGIEGLPPVSAAVVSVPLRVPAVSRPSSAGVSLATAPQSPPLCITPVCAGAPLKVVPRQAIHDGLRIVTEAWRLPTAVQVFGIVGKPVSHSRSPGAAQPRRSRPRAWTRCTCRCSPTAGRACLAAFRRRPSRASTASASPPHKARAPACLLTR